MEKVFLVVIAIGLAFGVGCMGKNARSDLDYLSSFHC